MMHADSPASGGDTYTSPSVLPLGFAVAENVGSVAAAEEDYGHGQPNRAIDSDCTSEMTSMNSGARRSLASGGIGTTPETKHVGDGGGGGGGDGGDGGDGGGGGGGGDGSGWTASAGPLASRSQAVGARQTIVRWALHFLQVLTLAIVIILLLVAVSVPVSNNGMPRPNDYTDMKFDWTTDPRSYLSPMNSSFSTYNILLDAHLHTTYSDGVLSPGQVVEYARANGYNAIIVTDHQGVEGSIAAKEYAEKHHKDQITVITGMEYTCCRIHMNLIGINESVTVSPPFPSDDELRSVINKVHGMGGLVIVNHIPWSNTTLLPWDVARLPNNPTREQLLEWGVDGFEVVNQNTFDLRSYQFVQQHSDRLVALTGSDMHYPGSSFAWTTINARNRSANAILNEIRNRRTSFLLDASGTRPIQSPPYAKQYFRYAPWGMLGDYFNGYADRNTGMYSFQGTFCQREIMDVHGSMIGWFFLWLLVSIVVLEILYWFFRWLILLAARGIHSRIHRRR
ncbi:hypothetical protein LPJ61_001409 [Coemansia biformis]|uniref:Polymerase/histidinol phosphatase N-terminal domain-containing protein n=1 Tax=Coemansia biformis TaxID=1286918 RepID=A0A9W7YEY8_9FUNG|nr:hypothetical protein LPJ61_001409 [Coemansia biformis]